MKNQGTDNVDNESDGFAGRLAECVDIVGNAATLSKMTGISRPTIGDYLSGKSDPSRARLVQISRVANVSLEWLATGHGSRTPSGIPALEKADRDRVAKRWDLASDPDVRAALDEANMQGFVALPVIDVTASAGNGAVARAEEQSGWVMFDRAWLYNTWHLNPADLFSIGSAGESMEPTIRAGEYLLASRAEDHLKPGDGIYIVRLDGHILVKRLQLLPGGKLIVSSDNPAYKPFEVELDDGVDFAILGKVVLVHGVRRV